MKPQTHLSAKTLIVCLKEHAIVFYRHGTVPEILHQFLGRVEDYRNCQNTRRGYSSSRTLPSEYYASSRFTILFSFRRTPLGNMKTPLKYAHTRELIQLHVSSCARHFYHLFGVFFSLQLCPIRVCMGRDTVCVRICTERDIVRPVSSHDRDVAGLRAYVARFCCRLSLSASHWPLRRSRTRITYSLTLKQKR